MVQYNLVLSNHIVIPYQEALVSHVFLHYVTYVPAPARDHIEHALEDTVGD